MLLVALLLARILVTLTTSLNFTRRIFSWHSKFDLVQGNCAKVLISENVLGGIVFKINDSAVPPTANPSDVTRAILRAWENEGKVTLRSRNEEHYRWYKALR